MNRLQKKFIGRRLLGVVLTALLLGGCAGSVNPMDLLEEFNRTMFALNDELDAIAIKPTAQDFEAVLPTLMQLGFVSNFFANSGDIFITANDLLQGKVPDVINDVGQVLANTPLGVLGFRDGASALGVEKHERTSVRLSASGA